MKQRLYAVREGKGAALVTGGYGCGKTLLSVNLLAEIKDSGSRAVHIFNPRMSVSEFLKEMVFQLGGDDTPGSKRRLLQSLNQLLLKNDSEGRRTVIIIDEAQAIKSLDIFEELRLLMNYQHNNRFLFTLVLFGQPELRDKMRRVPQFKQRISVGYHLEGLDEKQCGEYIHHRLRVAGMADEKAKGLISEAGITCIYKESQGVPRLVNNLCDMCLLIGFGRRLETIDENVVLDVIKDFS